MLENAVDSVQQRIQPTARRIGEVACAYAERIIAQLEDIHEAVSEETFIERRQRIYVNLAAGASRLQDIPQYEDWELEMLAAIPSAASTVTIRGGSMLIFAGNYTSALTDYGIGGIVQGGTQLEINATAATELYLQFKVRIPEKGKPARDRGDKRVYGPIRNGNEPTRHLQSDLDMVTASAGGLDVGENNQ